MRITSVLPLHTDALSLKTYHLCAIVGGHLSPLSPACMSAHVQDTTAACVVTGLITFRNLYGKAIIAPYADGIVAIYGATYGAIMNPDCG